MRIGYMKQSYFIALNNNLDILCFANKEKSISDPIHPQT